MRKIKAFSLAELLIALSIIGIVGALTVSVVSTNYKKSTYVAGLKNAYAAISDAANLIMSENNGSLVGVFANSNSMMNAFANILQPTRKCYAGQGPGNCWHSSSTKFYDLHKDQGDYATINGYPSIVLGNGSLMHFVFYGSNCNDTNYVVNGVPLNCGEVAVDINGFNSPNIIGRDIFYFLVTQNGLYADGIENSYEAYPGDPASNYCNPNNPLSGYQGYGCAGRVINEGGMNY